MNNVETYLNEAFREVALEIRTVDILELIGNIHTAKLANVGDIVHSALELHFKPNAVFFGYSGSVEMGWFGKPSVSLDLELHNAGVDAYFCLVIDAMGSSVAIRHLAVDGGPEPSDSVNPRLHEAIEQARLELGWDWRASGNQIMPGQHRLN